MPDLSQQALRVERLRALNAYDSAQVAQRIPELRERIQKGSRHLQHAIDNRLETDEIRLKLEALEAELRGLEVEYDLPCEAIEWLWAVSQSLASRSLPKGSVARIAIPGVYEAEVALGEGEIPF